MADELSKSDEIRKKLNKLMQEKPAYPAVALVDRYLLPYLDARFEEVLEYMEYLDDKVEGGDVDGDILDRADKLITLLVQLLDATFVQAGFLSPTGMTDKTPAELRLGFQAAQQQMAEWTQALAEYEAGADEEEDEGDEGPGPDAEAEVVPIVAAALDEVTTTPPAPAA